ncbi:hypothetical protein FHW67_001578 [Herbaspirillum sp. Sphag1AN]|nr:hypothetical protein [Herbaspirillum sp. Sphag1AN]MBB3245604.1 hypothetical protein [Herbaspirillum sp. Sphag64]
MLGQLGAPVGFAIAGLLFAYLIANLSNAEFLDWGRCGICATGCTGIIGAL